MSGVAEECVPECSLCENAIDFCLACNYFFLIDNRCDPNCPTTFYMNIELLECRTCGELGINCLDCINETACNTCDDTFVFYNNECLDYTPIGFANVSGIA